MPAPIEDTPAHPPAYRTRPVSFARRSERMTVGQRKAWDGSRERYVLDVPTAGTRASVDPRAVVDPVREFGREAPLVVEIGSGRGEAVIAAAQARPETDFLALEVYTPGLAQTIQQAVVRGLTNIRLLQVDAVEVLTTTLPPECADEVWVFFPDPWHKRSHHKRRLVADGFAAQVARVLRPDGTLRLATDWAHYATQMVAVLDAAPELENVHGPGGVAPRFEGRALTGFERKAAAAGREVTDLAYRRR